MRVSVVDTDPHHFDNLDPHLDPDSHQIKIRIKTQIRIKVISWIRNRIRIDLQTNQKVWNRSLFEHFVKGWSLFWQLGSGYGSASGFHENSGPVPNQIKIRFRIRIREISQIRIHMKVMRIHNPDESVVDWWQEGVSLFLRQSL
jgi:hypothetical protein